MAYPPRLTGPMEAADAKGICRHVCQGYLPRGPDLIQGSTKVNCDRMEFILKLRIDAFLPSVSQFRKAKEMTAARPRMTFGSVEMDIKNEEHRLRRTAGVSRARQDCTEHRLEPADVA